MEACWAQSTKKRWRMALGELLSKAYSRRVEGTRGRTGRQRQRGAQGRASRSSTDGEATKQKKAWRKSVDLPAEDRISGQVARLGRRHHHVGQLTSAISRRRPSSTTTTRSQDRQATDRYEWGRRPPDGNAYYDPTKTTRSTSRRDPAAAVRRRESRDAINYGGMRGDLHRSDARLRRRRRQFQATTRRATTPTGGPRTGSREVRGGPAKMVAQFKSTNRCRASTSMAS